MNNLTRIIGAIVDGWAPHLWGVAFLVILLAIQWMINPKKLRGWIRFLSFCTGEDNRLSLSKFQIWLWTHVALWSFIALFARAASYAVGDPKIDLGKLVPGLDPDILIVMGYSSLIAIGAKALVVNQINQGKRQDKKYPGAPIPADLFLNSQRTSVQLYNLQLFAWTLLSVGLYIYRVHLQLSTIASQLPALLPFAAAEVGATEEAMSKLAQISALVKMPNIGAELLFLMGISQTTYIGGKLIAEPGKALVIVSEVTQSTEDMPTGKVSIANLSLNSQSIALWKLRVDRKEAMEGKESYSFSGEANLGAQKGKTVEFSVNGDNEWKLKAKLSAGDNIVLLDASGTEVDRKEITEEDVAG